MTSLGLMVFDEDDCWDPEIENPKSDLDDEHEQAPTAAERNPSMLLP